MWSASSALERRSEQVLGSILDGARDLAEARYAAVGVPDGDGRVCAVLTAGVDYETWDRIGSLPRTHGLLGALLKEPEGLRRADIRADPRFRYYPQAHPDMRSSSGCRSSLAARWLLRCTWRRRSAGHFIEADQRLVETLAGHAVLAVVNAQRQERLRELSIVDERTALRRTCTIR